MCPRIDVAKEAEFCRRPGKTELAGRPFRRNRVRSRDLGPDRSVAAVTILLVTTVLLLIGFTGPSVEFKVPGFRGWIYIALIIIVTAAVLVRLMCPDVKRKALTTSASKTINGARIGAQKRR